MGPIRRQLLDMILRDDRYDLPASYLDPLRLEAARELFAERREQIPVLRRRAEDSGVNDVSTFADLVPLLFSHTVYKSYPQNLVEQGKWAALARWLKTLSVEDPTKVDLKGVTNVDDWIERMRGAGHLLLATSGSSGKCSFLNSTRGDLELKTRHFAHMLGWPRLKPANDRPVFQLGPRSGPNSAIEAAQICAAVWGRPGSVHFLTDEPLRISDVSAMAADEHEAVLQIRLRKDQRALALRVLPHRPAAIEQAGKQRRRKLRGADDRRPRGEVDAAEGVLDEIERKPRLPRCVRKRRPCRRDQSQGRWLRGPGQPQRRA